MLATDLAALNGRLIMRITVVVLVAAVSIVNIRFRNRTNVIEFIQHSPEKQLA
ncbi:hypothetical protein D3C87_1993340 [compost metagenome]